MPLSLGCVAVGISTLWLVSWKIHWVWGIYGLGSTEDKNKEENTSFLAYKHAQVHVLELLFWSF